MKLFWIVLGLTFFIFGGSGCAHTGAIFKGMGDGMRQGAASHRQAKNVNCTSSSDGAYVYTNCR